MVVALLLGWAFDCPLLDFRLADSLRACGLGAIACLPLLLFLVVSVWYPIWPFADLARVVDELLVPLFRECRVIDLAVISLLAGLGEEMLFRGVLQELTSRLMADPAGVWVGLAAASLLFGLAHAITPSYVLLASLMGLYLGWLWIATGNLWVPITAHALYDFLALVYMVKLRRRVEEKE